MSLFKRNTFLLSERGNIFFAIFGAIALIGVVGTVVITTMRGPLSTMVEVQNRTQAESEMAIASRLALLEATELAASGDCDGDGFVEPLEWTDAGGAGPAGGGFLPSEVASSRLDPWGTEYGYCAWDAGNVIDAMACDINSDTNYYRLDGNGSPTDETYTIIAVISAGPDQVFGTTCTGGASPDVTAGGDDIVTEFTYQGAVTATNGLWNLKSGDPATAEINKNLEVTGGASFTDGIDLTGSASALQLGAASMLFPTEATLATCNGANDGLIRINTTTNPDTLEVCDNTFGGWVSVGGATIWTTGAGDDIYYNTGTPQVGIGTTTPDDTLDVVGTLDVSGGVSFGSTLGVTGTSTLADTTVTTLGATGAVDFDTTLNVDGASTLVGAIDAQGAISNSTGDVSLSDNVTITGTLDAQGDVSDSTGDFTVADNMVVTGTSDLQGAVSDSTGDLTLGDSIVITGTTDARGAISNSTGNVDISDDLDVSNDLDVDGSADVDGTMEADDYTWNGNDFTPTVCASGNFNRWDGTSWSCDVDTSGSGSGGTNAGVFEDTGAAPTVIRMKSSIGTDYSDVDFVFGSPTLSAPADPNYYERFFFDKSLGAFRAGRSAAGSWDTANLGQYSFSGGADNTASGDYSTAFGGSSSATGNHSFAAGSSIASGGLSTAFGGSTAPGYKAQATGMGSTAMGIATTSSGNFSVSLGVAAVAGDAQFTGGDPLQGSLNPTVGEGSFAFGLADAAAAGAYASPAQFPRVTGVESFGIFMGQQTNYNLTANNRMALVGGDFLIDNDGTAGSQGCIRYTGTQLEFSDDCTTYTTLSGGSLGLWTDNTTHITRANAHVLNAGQTIDTASLNGGVGTALIWDADNGALRGGSASGTQWDDANIGTDSLAYGTNAQASGNYSVALGRSTIASASDSVALGWGARATASESFATGRVAIASGQNSFAIGEHVEASGINSGALSLGYAIGADPVVSGNNSLGIFMGDQSGYDLTTANRMALVGGDFLIDDDGTAGSQGCIRFTEGTGLEYSDDCTTFSAFNAISGSVDTLIDADGDTQIQVEQGVDDDTIRFDTDGAERMVILPTGEVGIGATPSYALHVNAGSGSGGMGASIESNPGGGSFNYNHLRLNNNNPNSAKNQILFSDNGTDRWAIGIDAQGNDSQNFYIWDDLATATRLRIESNGYIGIGNFLSDTVESQLHLSSGDLRLDGGAGNEAGCIRFNDTSDELEYSDDCSTYATFSSLGGATALSDLTAATAANTLTNGVNLQTWNWALTSAGEDAFTFGETTAATNGAGGQSVLKATTLASSTAIPMMVTNLGDGLSLRVNDETGDTDTTPFVIDADGNVGIGVAAPTDLIHARRDQDSTTYMSLYNLDTNSNATAGYVALSDAGAVVLAQNSLANSSGSSLLFSDTQSGLGIISQHATLGGVSVYTGATPSLRMLIQGNGNIGFGDFTGDTADSAIHLVSGEFRLDGGAANEAGCIRFNDTSDELEYSDDCSTYATFSSLGGAIAINDLTDASTDYVTDFNVFMGSGSGAAIASGGQRNIGIGQNTLNALTTSDDNIAIGYGALDVYNQTGFGSGMIALGSNALGNATLGNGSIAIGTSALSVVANSEENTAIGLSSFSNLSTGVDNTALGAYTGQQITNGSNNVFIGEAAGASSSAKTGVHNNVFIGEFSGGSFDTNARDNTIIGTRAGFSNLGAGDYNILIGSGVNTTSLGVDSQLNIGDTLYGDLANDEIGIGDFSGGDTIDAQLHLQEGEIRIDGGADNEAGCIRFNDTTDALEYSDDCSTYTSFASIVASSALWTDNTTHITRETVHILDTTQTIDTAGLNGGTSGLIWDTDNNALRGGSVAGTQWDDTNIGTNSVAFGENVIASGSNSFAAGGEITASGVTSTAFGWNGGSTGDRSFSAGYSAQSTNYAAISMGSELLASGSSSIALGQRTRATGDNSMALGLGNATTTQPVVSGTSSFGIFMGDQSGYDLTTANRMALVGGDFLIDDDGTAGSSQGCIRYTEGTGLEYSDDCSTYASFASLAGGATALDDITAADGTATINNAANAINWDWALTGAGAAFTFGENTAATGGSDDQYILSAETLATSTAIPVFINNLGAGDSFRVDDVAADTTPFIIDADGNVGIGTAAPVSNLEVYDTGGAAVQASISSISYVGMEQLSSGHSYLYHRGNGDLHLSAGDSSEVWIEPTGGTWAPSTGESLLTLHTANTAVSATPTGGDIAALRIQGSYGRTSAATITGPLAVIDLDHNFGFGPNLTYNASVPMASLSMTPTVNIATGSTQGYSVVYADVTETAISAGGDNRLIDLRVGGTPHFAVSNTGTALFDDAAGGSQGCIRYTEGTGLEYSDDCSTYASFSSLAGGEWTDDGSGNLYNTDLGNVRIGATGTAGAAGAALEIFYAGGTETTDPAILRLTNTTSQGSSKIQILEDGDTAVNQGFEFENYSSADGVDNYLSVKSYPNSLSTEEIIRIDRDTQLTDFRKGNVDITTGGSPVLSIGRRGGGGSSTLNLFEDYDGTPDGIVIQYDGANDLFTISGGGNSSYTQHLQMIRDTGNTGLGDFSADAVESKLHLQSGEIRLDGGAANEAGCIRYDDTADQLEFSHDCTTYTVMAGASGGLWTDNTTHITREGINILDTGATMESAGFDFGNPINGYVLFTDRNALIGGATGGTDSILVGNNSFAWGSNSYASGAQGISLGTSTAASGDSSVAIGSTVGATNDGSIAIGTESTSSGIESITLGSDVIASGTHAIAIGAGETAGTSPTVSGDFSVGIFMGDQDSYDLTTANRMALVGGDFLIDDDGTAGSQGCIRYLEGTGLQFSHDCSTFTTMGGGGTPAGADRQIQFNDSGAFGADSNLSFTSDGVLVIGAGGTDNIFINGGNPGAGTNGNVIIGNDAGINTTTSWNTFIGRNAGNANTSGALNVFIGDTAGQSNTTQDEHVFVGVAAGASNTTGWMNTFIGRSAGEYNVDAAYNTFLGKASGWRNVSGSNQTAVGGEALVNFTSTGNAYNVAVGYRAMAGTFGSSTGTNNTALGASAGDSITTGSDNILIGYNVDVPSATTSNHLNIGDTLYGDLANDYIGIGNSSPDVTLDVAGDIEYTGTITDVSDMRLKDNIEPLIKTGSLLERIDRIDTYSFTMKGDEKGRTEYGVMAQELEKIFPELVHTANDEMGTKSVNYVGLIAPMIEATKELRAENAALKAEQDSTKDALKDLSEQVALLNKVVVKDNTKQGSAGFMLFVLIFMLGGVTGFMALRLRRS